MTTQKPDPNRLQEALAWCKGDRPDENSELKLEYLAHAEKIFAPLAQSLPDHKAVIVISGPSGSGKSTAASLMAWLFYQNGRKPYVLSGDNYPHRVPEKNDACRMEIYRQKGREGLEAYLGTDQEVDFDQVNRIIEQFHEGKDHISMKRMGASEQEIWYEDVNVSDRDVLIVEWTHGCAPQLKGADARIFLEVSPETSRKRRLERGRDANAGDPFIAMVLEIEEKKLSDGKARADYVFSENGECLKAPKDPGTMKPMLNLYPDSLDGSLHGTVEFLSRPELKDVFGSLYILPSMYHYDLDRGFSVIDYDINEETASLEDLEALKNLGLDLKLDFVLNHASVNSPQFQDLLKNGQNSEYRDFFIDWNAFWKGCGSINEEGILIPDEKYTRDMFFRKAGLPVLMVEFEDGQKAPYWNTFYQKVWQSDGKTMYAGQMDLNLHSEKVWDFYADTLNKIASYGARILRLDAFAYACKAVGSRNFLNEPGTWDILEKIDRMSSVYGLQLLPEIHESYDRKTYRTIAEKGYMTYDFFAPGLILDAIETGSSQYLGRWIQEIIDNNYQCVNMLGCHDGIGLLDLKGLLPEERIQKLIDTVIARGGKIKDLHGAKNVYYQVNAAYYSALGEDDDKMSLARALQLFMPGKPQIWYLDLLGGTNDYAAMEAAGPDGHKEINRTNLSAAQIEAALKKDVVKKQLDMIRLRSTHPAFRDGAVVQLETTPETLKLTWTNKEAQAVLHADLAGKTYSITSTQS